jgi:hypothetical protein
MFTTPNSPDTQDAALIMHSKPFTPFIPENICFEPFEWRRKSLGSKSLSSDFAGGVMDYKTTSAIAGIDGR